MTDERPSIAELKRTSDRMTPGKWKAGQWQLQDVAPFNSTDIRPSSDEDISITVDDGKGWVESTSVIGGCGCCGSPFGSAVDAVGIAALHNSAPVMLEIVAAALAWRDSVANEVRAYTREEDALAMALSRVRP